MNAGARPYEIEKPGDAVTHIGNIIGGLSAKFNITEKGTYLNIGKYHRKACHETRVNTVKQDYKLPYMNEIFYIDTNGRIFGSETHASSGSGSQYAPDNNSSLDQ